MKSFNFRYSSFIILILKYGNHVGMKMCLILLAAVLNNTYSRKMLKKVRSKTR